MSQRCCVRGCDNTSERFPRKGNYFAGKFTRFPENAKRRAAWASILGTDTNSRKLVCAEHFTDDDWRARDIILNVPERQRRLKPDAVPSRKLPESLQVTSTNETNLVVKQQDKIMDEETRKRLVQEALAEYEVNYRFQREASDDSSMSSDNPLSRNSHFLSMDMDEEMNEETRKRLVAEALAQYDRLHPKDAAAANKKSSETESTIINQQKAHYRAALEEKELVVADNFSSAETIKCGEISFYVNHEMFILNCSHCSEIFRDLINFSNHVKAAHFFLFEKHSRNPIETTKPDDVSENTFEDIIELASDESRPQSPQPSLTFFSDDEDELFAKDEEISSENKDFISWDNQALVTVLIQLLEKNPIIWDRKNPLHGIYKIRRAAISKLVEPLSESFPETAFTYYNISALLASLLQMYLSERRRRQECLRSDTAFTTPFWCLDKLALLDEKIVTLKQTNAQLYTDELKSYMHELRKIATRPAIQLSQFDTAKVEFMTMETIKEYEQLPSLWNMSHKSYRGKLQDQKMMQQLLETLQPKFSEIMLLDQTQLLKLLRQLNQWFSAVERLRLYCEKFDEIFECKYPVVFKALEFLRGNIAPLVCNYCKSEFYMEHAYLRHTRQKKYKNGACSRVAVCRFCDKRFGSQVKLSEHLKMHDIERPFACNKCEKTFRCYSSWKAHTNRSHGRKTFECETCGRCYYTAGVLHIHKKSHLGIRDQICDICGKGFTNAKVLHNHISLVHRKKHKFECKDCGKVFRHQKSLLKHMETCDAVPWIILTQNDGNKNDEEEKS